MSPGSEDASPLGPASADDKLFDAALGDAGPAQPVGLAAESFSWMTRHPENPLARALARPGFELQRVAAIHSKCHQR